MFDTRSWRLFDMQFEASNLRSLNIYLCFHLVLIFRSQEMPMPPVYHPNFMVITFQKSLESILTAPII